MIDLGTLRKTAKLQLADILDFQTFLLSPEAYRIPANRKTSASVNVACLAYFLFLEFNSTLHMIDLSVHPEKFFKANSATVFSQIEVE